ncbi:MAG: sulfate/molybdate ABC transporter ATP-binding protein [Beijerinckiaceae bacterium]
MQIRVREIIKKFEPGDVRAALNGVSIDIESGELLALLGPSGSGKTTLLRIIAGLEDPDGGHVFFGDEDASRKSVQERRVGFVFQNYALFKHMTIAENIAFGLRVRQRASRPPEAEIRRRALELLDLVQLSGLAARRPAQLSGGQRQRVALARALAVEPKVLLLDEPFGALDAKVRRELRRWLREIHDRTGHTTIFVTHDQDEALELADRLAVLNLGRIEQVGTSDAVYDHPATPFIHNFIGEASSVAVELRDGRTFLGGFQIGLPAGPRSGIGRLFVRPHDVVISDTASGAIEGKVVAVRRTGATRRAEIFLPAVQETIEIDAPAAITFELGDTIPVRFMRGTIFPATD